MFDLQLGVASESCLLRLNESLIATHLAAPMRGSNWVYVSSHTTFDPPDYLDPEDLSGWEPFVNEIFRLRNDESGETQRYAHHYSRDPREVEVGASKYHRQPRLSVNQNGTRILFMSNWAAPDLLRNSTSAYCDVYQIVP